MTTDVIVPVGTMLNQMRFAPEQQKIERLMEAFELEPILSHFESEGGVKSIRDGILSSHLKLTRTMAPRLSAAMDGVCRALQYEAPVDLINKNHNALCRQETSRRNEHSKVEIEPQGYWQEPWNNNETWWCHYTVHLADFTRQRVRLSGKSQQGRIE